MAKDFKKKNPLDNLNTTANHSSKEKEPQLMVKKKVGRPKTKTEPTKTINIAVPVSLLEKTDIAKTCYDNNLTLYINKLIEKDIEANFKTYETIVNSLNNLK